MLNVNAVVVGNKAALMASYLVLGYAIGVVYNDVIAIFLEPDFTVDVLKRYSVTDCVNMYGRQLVHLPEVCFKAGHLAIDRQHCSKFFLDEHIYLGIVLKTDPKQIFVGFIETVEVVPMTEGPAPKYFYSPLNMSFFITGTHIAKAVSEAIVAFKLG